MTSLTELLSASKRPRIMNAQIVTKVPARVKNLVAEVAADRGVYDSDIVREALAEYFEKRGYKA